MRLVVFITSLFIFSSCTKNISALAHIKGVGSNQINGAATFIEENGFVKLMVELRGVDKEKIAIHIHELGDCESLDGSSAGGHWNPTQEQHGKWGELPFHSGDIGNIDIDEKTSVPSITKIFPSAAVGEASILPLTFRFSLHITLPVEGSTQLKT